MWYESTTKNKTEAEQVSKQKLESQVTKRNVNESTAKHKRMKDRMNPEGTDTRYTKGPPLH